MLRSPPQGSRRWDSFQADSETFVVHYGCNECVICTDYCKLGLSVTHIGDNRRKFLPSLGYFINEEKSLRITLMTCDLS